MKSNIGMEKYYSSVQQSKNLFKNFLNKNNINFKNEYDMYDKLIVLLNEYFNLINNKVNNNSQFTKDKKIDSKDPMDRYYKNVQQSKNEFKKLLDENNIKFKNEYEMFTILTILLNNYFNFKNECKKIN